MFQNDQEREEVNRNEQNDMLMYYGVVIDNVKQANFVSQSELDTQQQTAAHNRRQLVYELDPVNQN